VPLAAAVVVVVVGARAGSMTDHDYLDRLRSCVGLPAGVDRVALDEVSMAAIRRFADAMGDANPVYGSDTAAIATGRPGIVAPPATLPIWTMDGYRATAAARAARPDPSGGVLGLLAAEGFTTTPATNCRQDYRRELRPGDRLTMRSIVAGVSEKKRTALGPAHFVSLRSTFTDERGEAVGSQTMRVVAFNPDGERRPHAARGDDDLPDGDDRSPIAPPRFGEVTSGQRLPELSIEVDRVMVAVCSAACNDFRAGHYDPDAAQAIGMRDIIFDIPTSTGLTARYATDWCGPAGRLRSIDVSLGIPCCAGDTLQLTGTVAAAGSPDEVIVAVQGRTQFGTHLRATVTVALP
jgi:acyl dehydratase